MLLCWAGAAGAVGEARPGEVWVAATARDSIPGGRITVEGPAGLETRLAARIAVLSAGPSPHFVIPE